VTNSSGLGSGEGTNYLSGVTSRVDILFRSDFGIKLFFSLYILLVFQKAVYLSFLWSAVWSMVSDLVIDGKKKSH
jgi:hypothetical protein